MSGDAGYAEGREAPLRLIARDAEDLRVISALLQDAVFPAGEMRWDRRRRRFAVLLNRFRWEDRAAAERRGRPFERVQALLVIDDVLGVASDGLDPRDRDTVLSLLTLEFVPGDAVSGRILLTLAGDGAVAVAVECVEVSLRDVTRPYAAPSGKAPAHPDSDG